MEIKPQFWVGNNFRWIKLIRFRKIQRENKIDKAAKMLGRIKLIGSKARLNE